MSNVLKTDYEKRFTEELEKINQLESTPGIVRDHAVHTLQTVLKSKSLAYQDRNVVENGIQSLQNVATSSLQDRFSVIYAEMLVLAVSSLEATLKLYFENAVNNYTSLVKNNKRLSNLKVTVEEIIANELRFGGKLGKLILEKDKPNFQDLKSIKNIFSEYFGKTISMSKIDEKTVCFYLEARHLLVHKGGVVDEKFVKATAVIDANLKNYKEGDLVEISSEDWGKVQASFAKLVKGITAKSKN